MKARKMVGLALLVIVSVMLIALIGCSSSPAPATTQAPAPKPSSSAPAPAPSSSAPAPAPSTSAAAQGGTPAGVGSRLPTGHHLRAEDRRPVADAAAGSLRRQRIDLLASLAGLDGTSGI